METIIRHRDEGQLTWFLNSLVATKATAAETGGRYALSEHLLTADSDPPPHVHLDEDEAFYVLDGEVELEVDGAVAHATAGTFALAPSGRPHAFRVLTPTARVLVITSSAAGRTSRGDATEDFFRAAGTPATAPVLPAAEAPDPVRLAALAAAHGIEILPPPAP
ncbi:MAG TPA: cupin domain-containing protein [Acidimicrobiales bacterium]|nr:cupin domain-containing protein [Acidimicrobiales bacterium]